MSADDDRGVLPPVQPEARAAAQQRIEEMAAELAARYAKEPSAPRETPPPHEAYPPGRSFSEALESAGRRIAEEDAQRRRLPCFVAMYPGGVPDGYLDGPKDHAEVLRGARGCDAAKAEATCPHASSQRVCAQRQLADIVERTRHHLRKAAVEDHEHGLIMAAADGSAPLGDTDALRLVRAFLRHVRVDVPLEDGLEIDPTTGKEHKGRLSLFGTERLLVLGGAPGRGKTLAATYAIGRVGGRYLTEYVLARPREADVPALKRQPGVLVVDQLGRAVLDERRTSALLLEEIVDARYASRLDTILVPNMTFQQFGGRYGAVMLDRVAGHGAYADLAGPSLRPSTKGKR